MEAIQQSEVYIVIPVLCPCQRHLSSSSSSSRFKIYFHVAYQTKKQRQNAAKLLMLYPADVFVLVAAKTLFVYLRNHPHLHRCWENRAI